MSSTNTPTPKRYAISTAQKLAIRNKKHQNPTWTQAQLAAWFEEEFGQPIRQSSVSDALSNRYVHLHESTVSDRKKFRNARFPELEAALYEWYTSDETEKPVGGEALMAKAQEIWASLASFSASAEGPKFSNGWLTGFKKRYGIQQRNRTSTEGPDLSATPFMTPLQYQHLQRHSRGTDVANNTDPALIAKGNEGEADIPQVSSAEALKLIARLQLHELQAQDTDHEMLKMLKEYSKLIKQRQNGGAEE